MMGDKERGRLFSIQMDGSDSVPFIIKKDKLLIGRGDSCEIRIYVEGVSPEHCVITFNDEGRGYVEPINKCGLTFLNGELIERQVSLEHNDVITIVKRSFRFFYPSSSKFYAPLKPVTSSGEKTVADHLVVECQNSFYDGFGEYVRGQPKTVQDFDPEEIFRKVGKELQEKRVTFGPRLSPEEFDKNMPPASPLRRGSLPADKLKAKTPNTSKSHFKKALFNDNFAPDSQAEQFSSEKSLPRSTVVLHKLRCANSSEIQSEKNSTKSRPLFSEVLKKSAGNPPKDRTLQKYSPKRLAKKTLKLQNSKRTFYKSPGRPVHPRVLAVGSTGHANSPETIVIYKKRMAPSRRSSASLVKKRKSLRLERESSSSRKSISEVNTEDHFENPSTSTVNEPLSTLHSDLIPDANNSPVAVPVVNTDRSTPQVQTPQSDNQNDDATEKQAPASPLALAIDSVAQLDENNIDKSLKDIHNAVQALACHSNVSSALSNEPSSSDMCMNAVKKLALTISMVNAFHMYRRIIDDVSGFPLCFPSTSFDSSKDNMKCIQRSGAHSNEDPMDIGRLFWSQDIMRNFFSNSVRNDVYDGGSKCTFRSCENEVTSICSEQRKKSKFSSKRKVALRAIGSACKNPKCKSVHENDSIFSEPDQMQKTNDSATINECSKCTPSRSSCCEKSARISISESDKSLKASPHTHTAYCSRHSDVQNSVIQELATPENANLRKSRKSIGSKRSSEKLDERVQETFIESKRRHSLQAKKSPHSSSKGKLKIKVVKSRPVSAKLRTLRRPVAAISKSQKVPLVAQKRGITTSKKMKEQKKIQRHRINVLKKVNFKVKTIKLDVKALKQSLKSPTLLKKKGKRSSVLPAKQIRVSQKLLKQAKSRASTSLSVPHTSPKLLRKRNEKRKSIAFKSLGLRSKKSELPAKSLSKKRKSVVANASPAKQLRKNARGQKSESVKVEHVENEASTKSRKPRKQLETNADTTSVKKQIDKKTRSLVSDAESLDVVIEFDSDIDSTPVVKRKNVKRILGKNAKTSNNKKQIKTHSLEKNESKIVDSLDRDIDDQPKVKDSLADKRAKRRAKIENSLSPVKEMRSLRQRGQPKIQQNTDECLDSQVPQNEIVSSENPAEEEKPTESASKNQRSNKRTRERRREVDLLNNGNEGNQMADEQSQSDKKSKKDKAPKAEGSKTSRRGRKKETAEEDSEKILDAQVEDNQTADEQSKSDKKSGKGKKPKAGGSKITRRVQKKKSYEEDSEKILDSQVKGINQKTVEVLKDTPKNAAARPLRSKRLKTDSTSTETTEVVEKKENKKGRTKMKKNSLDVTEDSSQTKRGSRQKTNKVEDGILSEKEVKTLKQKRKRLDTNRDSVDEVVLIAESPAVIDPQGKRRKVNVNESTSTPTRRGRSKKDKKEDSKEKLSSTKASGRSLRSRK